MNAFNDQAVCVFTKGGACHDMSPEWSVLTGSPREDVIDRGFMDHVRTDYRDKLRHRFSRTEPDERGTKLRCQLRHENKSWHWYDLCVVDVAQHEGQVLFTCVLRHVTAVVQTEKKLVRALAQAELAFRSRSEFLANMSHELRTPLNAILGFSQIMQNQLFGKIGNSRYLGYLGNIQESGYALLDKINDLLEISQIDSGRAVLKEEPVDLAAVIRSAVEVHSHHAFSTHVTVHELPCKTPLFVQGDRVKLKQAISNLLSNALTYNRPGGTVHIQWSKADGGDIEISIADSGHGLTAKRARDIHLALQQEETFFERQFNGVGLGLSLAKEYIALHQGAIALSSKPRQGCTVTLCLPKERVLKATSAEPAVAKSRKAKLSA